MFTKRTAGRGEVYDVIYTFDAYTDLVHDVTYNAIHKKAAFMAEFSRLSNVDF